MDLNPIKVTATGFSEVVDYTSSLSLARYSLRRYSIAAGTHTAIRLETCTATLFVDQGEAEVSYGSERKSRMLSRGEGLHLSCKSEMLLSVKTGVFSFFAASSEPVCFSSLSENESLGNGGVNELSSYRRERPWGAEFWFTENIQSEIVYALKRIILHKGKRSSLQSHASKAESSLVLEGEAEVYCGKPAPNKRSAVVDMQNMNFKRYSSGQGWSIEAGELHRVIAREDLEIIEISTPELDDVIRWEDDLGRGDGG